MVSKGGEEGMRVSFLLSVVALHPPHRPPLPHRLGTILNSDRVLVLQAGRVAELDSPAALRNRPHSLFQQLLQSSQQGACSSREDAAGSPPSRVSPLLGV